MAGRGTTTAPSAYQYIHFAPGPGAHYYRLRQRDFDGTVAWSQVVSAVWEGAGPPVRLLPNPTRGPLTIDLGLDPGDTGGTIVLYDLAGRQVRSYRLSDRVQTISLEGLARGTYFLETRLGGQVADRQKLVFLE